MNDESPFPPSPDDPPQPIDDADLLEDLRNLIVTGESTSIKALGSMVSSLQARIEDRRGLITLLKPVIAAVLQESARENPAELRDALRPIVEEILWEGRGPEAARETGPVEKVRGALRGVKDRARAVFSRGHQGPPAVEDSPPDRPLPEVYDAGFALFELFLMARPSLVMLAHGSWQGTHVQADAEEQLLPLIRRFVTAKAGAREPGEPLQARFGRLHVHIEPGVHAYLVVLYEGTPAVGFLLDVRQALADLHTTFPDELRRSQAVPPYRRVLRLLLDRYRPTTSRMGAHANEDPITWPPPAGSVATSV